MPPLPQKIDLAIGTTTATKKKRIIKSSVLIFFAFATAFYSRIFCTLTRAPSILNFLHFATVGFAVVVALVSSRSRDRKQIAIVRALLIGILTLFGSMLVSALVNNAGLVNVIFNFLILGEPFIFLLAMISIPVSSATLQQWKKWFVISACINLILAIAQKFLLSAGLLAAVADSSLRSVDRGQQDATDGVQGVFFMTGAGAYVSAAVTVSFALYIFFYVKSLPLWLRLLGLLGAVYQILLSDTKQVVLTSALAWMLLGLSQTQNAKKFLMYATCIVLAIAAFIWAAYNLEAFEVYKYWFSRSDIYENSDTGGLAVKMQGIHMVLAHWRSPLNWLFGLGPGHTLGRLGGWSIKEYWSLLSPLGATDPPFYDEIWKFIRGNWIAMTTTLYVPLFSWAGIWGDLGWFGLGTYLYLGFIVWRNLCLDDLSRFLVLTVVVYGFFLTQMEEPGFMLSIAALIGLRWHEKRQLSQMTRKIT
ncbi:MAG: hypothetical protein ACRC2V_24790 [Xenococcaceae cyanobacterium]